MPWNRAVTFVVVAVPPLIAYVLTLNPTVAAGDSGELRGLAGG